MYNLEEMKFESLLNFFFFYSSCAFASCVWLLFRMQISVGYEFCKLALLYVSPQDKGLSNLIWLWG